MTISGGIKFFARSSALFKDGTTAVASSNSASANNILTNRQLTYWQSIGSDDLTTETITITFNQTVTIDRILLNRINFKEFTVKYDVASVWTDFTNVTGLDGALGGGISETIFSDETAYYEVDSITTTGIQITATKTQTADQEKIIYNLFTTEELGTFELYPAITPLAFSRRPRVSEALSGLANVQKGFDVVSFSLEFTSHGSQSDMDLLTTLYNRDKSFLVWLCGGRRGVTYFSYNLKGFGLRDLFNMQTQAGINPSFPGSVYLTAPNNSIALVNSL
jgi:hypothetical protein